VARYGVIAPVIEDTLVVQEGLGQPGVDSRQITIRGSRLPDIHLGHGKV